MDPTDRPLQPGDFLAGGLMVLVGAFWLLVCWRMRNARPPAWVASYRGGRSSTNALGFLGVALLGLAMTFLGFVPALKNVGGVAFLIMVGGVALWLIGTYIWFPGFLLPGWYAAAKRAGVNVRDPSAVQAFRDGDRAA